MNKNQILKYQTREFYICKNVMYNLNNAKKNNNLNSGEVFVGRRSRCECANAHHPGLEIDFHGTF